jgi:hypothetical protein
MSSKVSKETTIELSTGTTVDVEIEVFGEYDSQFGADADGNRGQGRWLIDSHAHTYDDALVLTSEEFDELCEKVEEIVYENEWDFDSAEEEDEDDADNADWIF